MNDEFSSKMLPEYARCIAIAVDSWATIEHYINECIWYLADAKPALGACITAQIFTIQNRLNALIALLHMQEVDEEVISVVNKYSGNIRSAQDVRNRIIHDMWLLNNSDPNLMGQFRVKANKKLDFQLQPVPLDVLTKDVQKIVKARKDFFEIYKKIVADRIPLLSGELEKFTPIRVTFPVDSEQA